MIFFLKCCLCAFVAIVPCCGFRNETFALALVQLLVFPRCAFGKPAAACKQKKEWATSSLKNLVAHLLSPLLRCVPDSNRWPPAWQAGILTSWTNAPSCSFAIELASIASAKIANKSFPANTSVQLSLNFFCGQVEWAVPWLALGHCCRQRHAQQAVLLRPVGNGYFFCVCYRIKIFRWLQFSFTFNMVVEPMWQKTFFFEMIVNCDLWV